ncbi:MAG: AF1514 family protein [Betaproteobacteria bacterium]|nr:AF1514 family protein [Betaproteobacteria bacterium]
MKEAHINYAGIDLNYRKASVLAASLADSDENLIEPVMVAWHDKKAARMSPVIEGCDINTSWHDYGKSHGGKLEVDINGEYDFIFGDSSAFEPYGPSPYINLRDKSGNEYLCQINALRDPHSPSEEACVPLDDMSSKQT